MDHIRKEIRMFLLSAKDDFEYERHILHDHVVPLIRHYCMDQYNIDFLLIDPNQITKNQSKFPQLDTLFFENCLKDCQRISDGPSCLILAGERLGNATAPATLTKTHYAELMKHLKASNNPTWMVLQSVYSEDASRGLYALKKDSLSDEDNSLIINGISMVVQQGSIKSLANLSSQTKTEFERYLDVALGDKKFIDKNICLTRNIKESHRLNQSLRSRYIDIDGKGLPDELKMKKSLELREKISRQIPKDTYLRFSVPADTINHLNKDTCSHAREKPVNQYTYLSFTHDSIKSDLTAQDYLSAFMQHMIDMLKKQIEKAMFKKEYNERLMFKEIETNLAIFESLPEVKPLRDRDRELKIVSNYLTSVASTPGLLYGEPGCGKSILLKAIHKRISSLMHKTRPIIVLRSAGKTNSTSTLQLLLSSITEQIYTACKMPSPNSCEYATCVYELWRALKQASASQPIIILIDNVDAIYPLSHTESFRWLPSKLPPYVKVLMTTSLESVYNGFQHRYEESSAITIPGLDTSTSIALFPKVMQAKGKIVDEKSTQAANVLLQENSAPLYGQILADILPVPDADKLPTKVKELFKKKIELMEKQHGSWITKYVLSYLATSKLGLSFSEMQDLLCLENSVVKECGFDYNSCSIYSISTHYQLSVLHEIRDYLIYVQVDDRYLITFKHDSLRTAIIDYYQLIKDKGIAMHMAHAEYWMGRYSWGKPKPLFEKSTDDDENLQIQIDRCAIHHHFYWTPEGNQTRKVLCNTRKLTELPRHLTKADRSHDIFNNIIFCYDYLYSKLQNLSVNDLVADLYFMRQCFDVKNNQEVEILISLLRTISSILDNDAEFLGPELSGRLAHVVGKQPLITSLLQQLDMVSYNVNSMLPTIPCYRTLDPDALTVDLMPTRGNIVCSQSPDSRFVATLLPTDAGVLIVTWDSKTATKSQIVNLGAQEGLNFTNIYYIPQSDEFLLLEFKTDNEHGIHYLDLEYSLITQTLRFPKSINPQIWYIAKSYIIIKFNNKAPKVFEHPSGNESTLFKDFAWPYIVTPSDKYLIAPKPKVKSEKRAEPDLRVVGMINHDTLCNLSCSLPASTMIASSKNDYLFVGSKGQGMVYRYDIGQIAKRDIKKMKAAFELSLSSIELPPKLDNIVRRYLALTSVKSIQISNDEKFILVEYDVNDIKRICVIWNIANKSAAAVFARKQGDITRFSHDSWSVYQFVPRNKENTFLIVYSITGNKIVQEILLKDEIQDAYIMKLGYILLVFKNEIVLTTLKHLEKLASTVESDQTQYCIALKEPTYAYELNIVYSNAPDSQYFQYYNMDHNTLISVDVSHCSRALSQHPLEKFISSDGTKVIFSHASQAEMEMRKNHRRKVSDFIMQHDSEGHLIHSHVDFRKPEIPMINYYTGFSTEHEPSNPKIITSSIVHQHRILRVFDLESSMMTCQISLTGEQVLTLTSNHLFTFRPDYASGMRVNSNAMDVITIYDLSTGAFVHSIYVEHPMISMGLTENNTKLMVSCGHQGKWLRLYDGEYFDNVVYEVDIEKLVRHYDEYARVPNVRKLFVFKNSTTTALLGYFFKEPEKEIYYCKVDLPKRDLVAKFQAYDFVQDVSRDGSLAVDSILRVYDLNKGEVLRKLLPPIFIEGEALRLLTRFTDDGAFVIALDNDRNCISVIKNDAVGATVGKCLLHRLSSKQEHMAPFDIRLSHGGKIIVLFNHVEFKIFVLRDVPSVQKSPKHKALTPADTTAYKNILERIRFLMPHNQYNSVDEDAINLGQTMREMIDNSFKHEKQQTALRLQYKNLAQEIQNTTAVV